MVSYTKICVALAAINMMSSYANAVDFPATTGKVGDVAVAPGELNGVVLYDSYNCDDENLIELGAPGDMRNMAGRAARIGGAGECLYVIPDGSEGTVFWGARIGSYPDLVDELGSAIMFVGEADLGTKKAKGKVQVSVGGDKGVLGLSGSVENFSGRAKLDVSFGPCSAAPLNPITGFVLFGVDGGEISQIGAGDEYTDMVVAGASGEVGISVIDGGSIRITAANVVGDVVTYDGDTVCGDIVYLPAVQGYAAVWADAGGVFVEGRVQGLQKDGGDTGSFHMHSVSPQIDDASFEYPDCSTETSIGDHMLYNGQDYWAQVGDAGDVTQADTFNTYTSVAGGTAILSANLADDKTPMADLQYQALVVHTERAVDELALEQRVGCGNAGGAFVTSDEKNDIFVGSGASPSVGVGALSAFLAAGYALLN